MAKIRKPVEFVRTLCFNQYYRDRGAWLDLHTCTKPTDHTDKHSDGNIEWPKVDMNTGRPEE